MILDADMEEFLLKTLEGAIDDIGPHILPSGIEVQIDHVSTFAERGVMTMSRGIVLDVTAQFTPDEDEDDEPRTERAQFQLTIVRSR
jgi:hypothetical protein